MRFYCILCFLIPAGLSAYTNMTLQLVASSGESSSASYTAKGGVLATGGTATQSSSYTHYSGDAAAYILKPSEQHSSGVAYEWLADNDSDALSDAIEAAIGSDLHKPDTDEDGLSDADEHLIHGTSLLLADSDHDGSPDPDEVVAGTSPLDASSRFSANIMPGSNGRLALEWFGVLGRSYSIESAPSPAGPWSQYSPFTFPGNNAPWGVEFPLSETEDKAFYRVTIE